MKQAVVGQDVALNDLGVVEVDLAVSDVNADLGVVVSTEFLTILKERRIGDLLESMVTTPVRK